MLWRPHDFRVLFEDPYKLESQTLWSRESRVCDTARIREALQAVWLRSNRTRTQKLTETDLISWPFVFCKYTRLLSTSDTSVSHDMSSMSLMSRQHDWIWFHWRCIDLLWVNWRWFFLVLMQNGGHHTVEDFSMRGKEPKDEVQIYTWRDATLRELTDLVSAHSSLCRSCFHSSVDILSFLFCLRYYNTRFLSFVRFVESHEDEL